MGNSHPASTFRRLVTSAGALGAAALLLAGCTSSTEPTESGDAAVGATVSTKFGDIEVPENPERVVTLGWGDAETALALGVQPVGASDWLDFGGDGVGPWADGLYDESPEIIGTMEPDFEQIAALEPDVIFDVNSAGDPERYDRLSQIAPTVGVPEGADSYLTPLDQQVEMIAEALGKADEGDELLTGIDEQFAQARRDHPEFEGKSVAVGAFTSEGWGAYVEGSSRVQFMSELGFNQAEAIEELTPEGFSAPVSQEQLGVLDADLLLVFPIYLPASEVTDQPEFQRLAPVEEGHAIVFDETDETQDAIRNAYSLNSVLSVPFAIEEMVPLAAEHVAR